MIKWYGCPLRTFFLLVGFWLCGFFFHFGDHCIAPHLFQPIKFAGLRLKYMDHHIDKINDHPMQSAMPFMPVQALPTVFPDFRFHMVCNRFYLCAGAPFGNHKKISHRLGYLTKIEGYDMLSFFILDGFRDDFQNLAALGKASAATLPGSQFWC